MERGRKDIDRGTSTEVNVDEEVGGKSVEDIIVFCFNVLLNQYLD